MNRPRGRTVDDDEPGYRCDKDGLASEIQVEAEDEGIGVIGRVLSPVILAIAVSFQILPE